MIVTIVTVSQVELPGPLSMLRMMRASAAHGGLMRWKQLEAAIDFGPWIPWGFAFSDSLRGCEPQTMGMPREMELNNLDIYYNYRIL
jgi:hypothetical protein